MRRGGQNGCRSVRTPSGSGFRGDPSKAERCQTTGASWLGLDPDDDQRCLLVRLAIDDDPFDTIRPAAFPPRRPHPLEQCSAKWIRLAVENCGTRRMRADSTEVDTAPRSPT
jgi:hypothetical protein